MPSVSPISNANSKPKKIKNKGKTQAYTFAPLAALPFQLASGTIASKMQKVSILEGKDLLQINNAAEEGLKKTGLVEKDVRIFRVEVDNSVEEKIKSIIKVLKEKISKKDFEIFEDKDFCEKLNSIRISESSRDKDAIEALISEYKAVLAKIMPKGLKDKKNIIEQTVEKAATGKNYFMFKLGKNAGYLSNANKIIVPDKKLATSVFHEMGHALNNNGGIILKSLMKMRNVGLIVSPIVMFCSLLNKRKATDKTNENDSVIQKGADFIKRNAGKITFLSFLPMITEEGIASLRGQGLAKSLVNAGKLSTEIFKKVKITNALGFATYVLAGISAAIVARTMVKIKDEAQEKYEAKLATK